MNILITSFGSNTSIGVAKRLKINHFIIGTDINEPFECNGFDFADVIEKVPRFDNSDYAKSLLDLTIKYDVDLIIPIHDRELEILSILSEQQFFSSTTKVAVNINQVISLCNDKKKINKEVRAIGIPVPVEFDIEDDIEFTKVIVKDNRGVSSRGMIITENLKKELQEVDDKIIQEFIEGNEYTVDCYSSYIDADAFFYSVRERKETKGGMSTKSEIIDLPKLGEYCKKIHDFLNYKGVSNIQFIEKDGFFYFIEINPRFAGAGILTYSSGYDFPNMTVEEICSKKRVDTRELSFGNKMVRYYEETFFDCNNIKIN